MGLVCEGAPDPGWSDGPLDARKARLSDVVEDVSTKTLRYLYDFGDGWDHTIKIERLIPVIPILLEGTTIPSADQLPSDLQELSLRNGINVRHDSFHNDIDRLARGLKEQLRGGNWRDIFSSARDERTDRGESSVTEGRYSTCWCPRLKGRSTRRGS